MLKAIGVRLMNSASVVEIVTIVCFRFFQIIGQPVKKTIWLLMETFMSRSSANDASPYICKWRLEIYWRLLVWRPKDFVFAIYFQRCFNIAICFFVGLLLTLARQFVVY